MVNVLTDSELTRFTNDKELPVTGPVFEMLTDHNPTMQSMHEVGGTQVVILQASQSEWDATSSVYFAWMIAIDYKVQEFSTRTYLSIGQCQQAGAERAMELFRPSVIDARTPRRVRMALHERTIGEGMPRARRRLRMPGKA